LGLPRLTSTDLVNAKHSWTYLEKGANQCYLRQLQSHKSQKFCQSQRLQLKLVASKLFLRMPTAELKPAKLTLGIASTTQERSSSVPLAIKNQLSMKCLMILSKTSMKLVQNMNTRKELRKAPKKAPRKALMLARKVKKSVLKDLLHKMESQLCLYPPARRCLMKMDRTEMNFLISEELLMKKIISISSMKMTIKMPDKKVTTRMTLKMKEILLHFQLEEKTFKPKRTQILILILTKMEIFQLKRSQSEWNKILSTFLKKRKMLTTKKSHFASVLRIISGQ